MLGISHLLISRTTTALFLGTAEPSVILSGAIAGLLPDIDTSLSPAGRMFPWIAAIFESKQGHRGASHSLLASALIASTCYAATFFFPWFLPYASAITIGFSFGWFADVFTQGGVEMFWPVHLLCVCPGNRHLRLRTGSNGEYIVLAFLIAIALTIFSVNSHGGLFTQFNRLIASPSGVVHLYNEQGDTHKIIATIQGVRSSDRAKIEGKFLLVQQSGNNGFIVLSDGKLYKASNEPDAQILIENITADVGDTAVTSIESVNLDDEPINTVLTKFSRSGALVFVSGQLTSDDIDTTTIPHDPYQFQSIKASKESYTLEAAPLEQVLSVIGDEFGTGVLQVRSINSTVNTQDKKDIY